MNTNLRAVHNLTKLAIPHLVKSKGNIVNVSSVAGIRASQGFAIYNYSKAALDQLTRCTALEVASRNVRVNSVNPGGVKTDTLAKSPGQDQKTYDAFIEGLTKKHPIGRLAEPREIATVIAFLASNLASNVTGINMPVDGGCLAQ